MAALHQKAVLWLDDLDCGQASQVHVVNHNHSTF